MDFGGGLHASYNVTDGVMHSRYYPRDTEVEERRRQLSQPSERTEKMDALKIQVVRVDGRHVTFTLTPPVSIVGMCLKTGTGCDHFFTEEGLYDGWGLGVVIPGADRGEVRAFIEAVDRDREIEDDPHKASFPWRREMNGADVVPVYKRIFAAVAKGKGVRLSAEECHAIWCDGATRQCVETAEDEERIANDD